MGVVCAKAVSILQDESKALGYHYRVVGQVSSVIILFYARLILKVNTCVGS